MTRIDDLERCPECGASMEVYARTCPACHADLFDAKVSFFREWRDGGGMTDEACEIAIAILGEGAREPRARDEPRERKQVTDLTLDDLERCPVWQFAIDEEGNPGQDEATVKPRPDVTKVNLADGLFVLAARFESNDGSTFRGYVTPGERPDDMQPTVVTAAGEQISFWSGIVMPEREEIEDAYRTLAKTPGELFPLQVEALVETANGTLTATIEGFGYYDNSRRGRVVT